MQDGLSEQEQLSAVPDQAQIHALRLRLAEYIDSVNGLAASGDEKRYVELTQRLKAALWPPQQN